MKLAMCLPLVVAGACGDDGGGGSATDAGGGDGDGDGDECNIHNPCDGGDEPARLEGGEFRFEYLETPGFALARGTGFLLTDQDTFPMPELDTCVKIGEPATVWWFGQTDGRNYVDLGPTVTISGGTEAFEMEKGTGDFFAREHDISYTRVCRKDKDPEGPNQCDWTQYLSMGTEYEVEVAGSDQWEGQTYTGSLYLPSQWDAQTPDFTGPVALTAGDDFTVEWEVADDSARPDGGNLVTLVGFLDAGVPHTACLTQNDGSFTVPSDIIDQLPAAGTLVVGVTYHVIEDFEFAEGSREVDFIGMNCKATGFSVAAP